MAKENFLSPQDITNLDPFALIYHYNGTPQKDLATNSGSVSVVLDITTAQQLLTDALKMGDDRFYDLAGLLLDENPIFAEQQSQLNSLFSGSQALLLPCKLHSAILVGMQSILENSLQLINSLTENVNPMDFYKLLISRCTQTEENEIRLEFHNHVGMYLHDLQEREEIRERCLRALQPYLPKNIKNTQQSYFAISADFPIEFLRKKIEHDIQTYKKARNNAHEKYARLAQESGSQELENRLSIAKRTRRQTLTNKILAIKDYEKEAGLPYAYKDRFTLKQLLALASLVSYDTILDQETGTNVALMALEYNNCKIYKDFFSTHKHLAKTTHCNRFNISAEFHEKALFWENVAEKEEAMALIKQRDIKGWALRPIEKQLHQYLQAWHKKNQRLYQDRSDKTFMEKIIVGLMEFFYNKMLFVKRPHEAEGVLRLIHDALSEDIPIPFYELLKRRYDESNHGRIKGSYLYVIVHNCLTFIRTNETDLRILINPSPELTEQVKKLKRQLIIADAKYKEDLKTQKENFAEILEQSLEEQKQQQAEEMRSYQKNFKQDLEKQGQNASFFQQEEVRNNIDHQLEACLQQLQAIVGSLEKKPLEKFTPITITLSSPENQAEKNNYSPTFYAKPNGHSEDFSEPCEEPLSLKKQLS